MCPPVSCPPLGLYQLLWFDPDDLEDVVPLDPTGRQYGPEPFDFSDLADWIDLADFENKMLN